MSLRPHAHTVPSSLRARLWLKPHAIAETPVNPDTCTGVVRRVVVPSPSCPLELPPHARSTPSSFSARLKSKPPVRLFTRDESTQFSGRAPVLPIFNV